MLRLIVCAYGIVSTKIVTDRHALSRAIRRVLHLHWLDGPHTPCLSHHSFLTDRQGRDFFTSIPVHKSQVTHRSPSCGLFPQRPCRMPRSEPDEQLSRVLREIEKLQQ